jgi:hypothetical protein
MSALEGLAALGVAIGFILALYAALYAWLRRVKKPKVQPHPHAAVHQDEQGWWFWDEVWCDRYGPFACHDWAVAAMVWYAQVELEGGHEVGTRFRFRCTPFDDWGGVVLTEVRWNKDRTHCTYTVEELSEECIKYYVPIVASTLHYLMPEGSPMIPEYEDHLTHHDWMEDNDPIPCETTLAQGIWDLPGLKQELTED